MEFNANLVVVDVPLEIHIWPVTTIGIAYDIGTHPVTDPVPIGWGYLSTSSIYRKIAVLLMLGDFFRVQKSVWHCAAANYIVAWNVVLSLRTILPARIFPSTVQKLELFAVHSDVLILDPHICLGGQYSPALLGPTPAGLVEGNAIGIPPAPNAPNGIFDHRHVGIRSPLTLISGDPNSWRQ